MTVVDITELLTDLPSDKRDGLCELGTRVRKLTQQQDLSAEDSATLCKLLEKYANKNSLDIHFESEARAWDIRLQNYLRTVELYKVDIHAEKITDEIDDLVESYGDQTNSEIPFGYAVLSLAEKSFIQDRLSHIKSIIENSKLKDNKKNALYKRISKLAMEVDRNGTRTDAFFGFGVDLAMTAGEMAQKAKPALDEFKEVLKIVLRRRAENEGVELPKPEDYPHLPPPER